MVLETLILRYCLFIVALLSKTHSKSPVGIGFMTFLQTQQYHVFSAHLICIVQIRDTRYVNVIGTIYKKSLTLPWVSGHLITEGMHFAIKAMLEKCNLVLICTKMICSGILCFSGLLCNYNVIIFIIRSLLFRKKVEYVDFKF